MRTSTSLIAIAQLLAVATAQGNTANPGGANTASNATTQLLAELANLEHYYAYGRSPPFYPSREFLFALSLPLIELTSVKQLAQVPVTGRQPTPRLALSLRR